MTDDIDGNARPYGAEYDIGAYENITKNFATGKIKKVKVPKKLRKKKKVVVTFKKKKKSKFTKVKYRYKLMNKKGKKIRAKTVKRKKAHKSGKKKARITIKKLKQKPYKIKLRTIRTLNGVKFKGKWSRTIKFRPAKFNK